MRSVVDRNVVMRRIPVNKILQLQAANALRIQPSASLPLNVFSTASLIPKQVYCAFPTVSVLITSDMAPFYGDTMSTISRFSGNLLPLNAI